MAVTVITLLALIVAFIFTQQQQSTLPAQPLQLYVSKQWVVLNMTNRTSFTITPPIAFSRCFAGVVSDYGDARLSFGLNKDKLVCYGPGLSTNTVCNIIMIGIQTVGKKYIDIKRPTIYLSANKFDWMLRDVCE